ncbi:Pre-mRNA splicing factor-domain-containing protein [Radiomyces spectabilis]|uniref:Pre-mRNA splicing factor-domain-containing protein n=1 Tax=Radiomyces spectabilis TaxID=64574 RepID=UPI0022202B6F|nr:Pre-mRNA splicing factor-domain-containing protein [Radiomyces spectabilis]KAI8377676.1 Pre-mRNA splicing factor-domain-containing protein [Radiomyces spectabilis]
MGGGDLNLKKSWHPVTFKNQERVWKEEKKHAEEQRKIEQMKKELMEERQLQDLQRLQEDSGGRKRSERVDWMYAAPNAGGRSGGVNSEMEEFLLGKKNVDELLRSKSSREEVASTADRFALSNANANNERDIQAKIREDPLLMIKKREQAAVKAIVDNPLRMKELRRQSKDKKKKKKDIRDKSDRHSKHKSDRHHSKERRSDHRHDRHSHDRHSTSRSDRHRSRSRDRSEHRSRRH